MGLVLAVQAVGLVELKAQSHATSPVALKRGMLGLAARHSLAATVRGENKRFGEIEKPLPGMEIIDRQWMDGRDGALTADLLREVDRDAMNQHQPMNLGVQPAPIKPPSPPATRPTNPSRAVAQQAQEEALQLTQQKAPRKQIISKLKQALRYWRLAGDKKKQYMTLSFLIHQYQQSGDYPQVLQYAQQSLSVAQAPHQRRLALGYASLAYKALGEYQQDATLNKDRLFESDDPETLLLSSLNLADTYAKLGDGLKAMDPLNQLIAYWQQKREPIRQAEAMEGLSLQLLKLGEYNKGLELVRQVNQLDPERKRNPVIRDQGLSLAIGQVCSEKLKPFAVPEAARTKTTDQKPLLSIESLADGNFTQESKNVIAQLQQRIQGVRAQENRSLEAGMLTGLAVTYASLGESKQALDHYRQALQLYAFTGEQPRQANTLGSIANLYGQQGKYQEAINHHRQALDIQHRLNLMSAQAVTLVDLGGVYQSLGDHEASILSLQQALALFQQIGDRRREADAILKIGNLYRQQKNYPMALGQFEQALAIAQQSGNCLLEHSAHLHMSRTHEDAGHSNLSYQYGQKAFTLATNLSDVQFKPARIANALNLMARAKTKAGEFAASLEFGRRSLNLTRQAKLEWANPHAYDVIADAHAGLKQYDQAIEAFDKKLIQVRRQDQYSQEAYIFYFLAKMEREKGRLATALKRVDSALDVVENIRQDLLSPELRTSFFAAKQDYYELKTNLLMELHQREPRRGHDAQAFNTSERRRARTLLELLNESKANIRQGVDSKLIEEESSIRDRFAALERRWAELASQNPTEKQLEFLGQQRKLLLAQYQSVQDIIRAQSPKYAALKYPQPLTLAQIRRQLLEPDTTLLQYSLGKDNSYLWIVSRDGLQSHRLPPEKEIETLVKSWRNALLDKPDTLESPAGPAIQLARLLLEPAAVVLQSRRRLIVVPDGALHYAPFAALPVGGQPLVAHHTLLQLPSSSTLALIRGQAAQRPPAPLGLAMVADPIFSGDDPRLSAARGLRRTSPADQASSTPERTSRTLRPRQRSMGSGPADALPRLPGTRREAERILSLFPAQQTLLALDAQASLKLVQSPDLANYRYVHLATHGVFNTTEPALSGVILSLVDQRGQAVNGFLRLNEIVDLNLPAELVVLSACETGLGEQIRGEGMVGLTRGFLYAGSRRLLVSLWKVDDDATVALMTRFYEGLLREKLSPAQALRVAQNHLRTNTTWDSPYFWSGFMLQGEW